MHIKILKKLTITGDVSLECKLKDSGDVSFNIRNLTTLVVGGCQKEEVVGLNSIYDLYETKKYDKVRKDFD